MSIDVTTEGGEIIVAQGVDPAWHGRTEVAGGKLLRAIRQDAGHSLIALAGRLEDRGVRTDAAHIQRIETGQIARPTAETLDAILTHGLDAPYRTRRDVLEAFGYRLPWDLPTERE